MRLGRLTYTTRKYGITIIIVISNCSDARFFFSFVTVLVENYCMDA